MGHEELPVRVQSAGDAAQLAAGQRSTWVSIAVNALLTLTQLLVGLWANAQSLVADSMHSLSDMLSDGFVLVANRRARDPADAEHPYGHGRIETATSLLLGLLLALVGVGFLWSAGSRLQHLDALPHIAPLALWTALLALVAKESLFRYQLAVGERLRSPMLVANAWHQRADAASSLVVAAGIGGNLLGVGFADLLAAAIVGFMILRMGCKFGWEALRELIDTGVSAEEAAAIAQTLRETPGVLGLHELRSRRMARHVLVDAHVLVKPRISVSEGHRIAESARSRVLQSHAEVLDVLVHVDAENDEGRNWHYETMPSRSELLAELAQLLAGQPADRIVFHYLSGGVEAEVFLDPPGGAVAAACSLWQTELQARVKGCAYFRKVTLNFRVAL
jgi:cation diffusion facilitator family transporter